MVLNPLYINIYYTISIYFIYLFPLCSMASLKLLNTISSPGVSADSGHSHR